MERLIAAQHELFGLIAHTIDNVRKIGATKVTLALVQSSLKLLDQKWISFEERHNKLREDYWDNLKIYDYLMKDFVAQVEEVYHQQRATLLEFEQNLASARASEEQGRAGNSSTCSDRQQSLATLPRIELPRFSGRVEDWPALRDLFTSLICKKDMLTQVEKLHYLKVSVRGNADELIRNLPVTEDNFLRAWAMLTNYFDKKRLLVRGYLSSFTALAKMKTESAVDLRRISNCVLTTVASLEGIGRPITDCSDLFVHLVVDLLDPKTRREWEDAIGRKTDPPSYVELLTFLEQKPDTLDALSSGKTDSSSSKCGDYTRVA